MTRKQLTAEEYSRLQQAYDYFNDELFAGSLPQVLLTLQRHPNSKGYFSPKRFESRNGAAVTVDELALNPALFYRTDLEILSTLVHEMAHVWQEHHDSPSRNGYHNREWADKMIAIGLYPSDTGEPGGKVTGQAMTHYILDDGEFKTAAVWLLDDGWTITFASVEGAGLVARPGPTGGNDDDDAPNGDDAPNDDAPNDGDEEKKPKKPKSKVKFSCPACGQIPNSALLLLRRRHRLYGTIHPCLYRTMQKKAKKSRPHLYPTFHASNPPLLHEKGDKSEQEMSSIWSGK